MRKLSLPFLLLSAAWSVASAQDEFPAAKSETEARNLETMRLWGEEVWGNGRLELVPDLVAPEYVRHDQNGTRITTPDSYVQEIRLFRGMNMVFDTHAIAIDENLLWTRWSANAQTPDGVEIVLKGMQVYRFADGKLAETWLLSADGEAWPDD